MRRVFMKIAPRFSLFGSVGNTRFITTSSENSDHLLKERVEEIDRLCEEKKFDEALGILSKFDPDRPKSYALHIKSKIEIARLKSTGEYEKIFGEPFKNLLNYRPR